MSQPFLHLRALHKRFGRIEALRGVSLQMPGDELLVILGPTGAGKTTLLRAIAGLEALERGTVTMDGADVTNSPPAERDVAMVFQDFSLYPNKTVRENLEFPLRAAGRKLDAGQIATRVQWAAGLLRIAHLLQRPATKLSGGEMQRVAIGRAIVRRPRLFLLDEPLSNLDAKLREELRVELVMLRHQLKTPMIFVTHDQTEAMSMGDRIAVLNDGAILQIGTPRQVYCQPVSPVVARQLGQPPINLLPLRRIEGKLISERNDEICPDFAPAPQDRALLGIRPEDIEPAGGRHPAKVLVVEDTGPARILLVRWLGFDLHILATRSLTVRAGEDIFPRIRTNRAILWPMENSA